MSSIEQGRYFTSRAEGSDVTVEVVGPEGAPPCAVHKLSCVARESIIHGEKVCLGILYNIIITLQFTITTCLPSHQEIISNI
jgi:hypothetical protein